MLKKSISVLLALMIIIGAITVTPAASAKEVSSENDGTKAGLSGSDVAVTGKNSLGTMLASEFEENMRDAETSPNNIFAVEIDGTTAFAEIRTVTKAKLVVSIFDEYGEEMYGTGMTTVVPDDSVVKLSLDIRYKPKYFLIKAYLLDDITNIPLCKMFESDIYTQEMQEFFSKTTDDFEEDRVLNLDKDKTDNFLVYNEETILIDSAKNKNVVTLPEEGSKEYIISNIDNRIKELDEGDIFSCNHDNDALIIKVSSIRISGTTAVITGDDVKLEEVFEYIRIEGSEGANENSVDNSGLDEDLEYVGAEEDGDIAETGADGPLSPTGYKFIDKSGSAGISLKYKFKEWDSNKDKDKDYGVKLTGSIAGSFNAEVSCYYDLQFTRQEIKFSFALKYELKLALELEFSASHSWKLGKIIVPVIAGVIDVTFTPSFIVEGKITGEINGKLSGQFGFSLTNGKFSKDDKAPKFTAEVSVSAEVLIGLSMEPAVEILAGLVKCKATFKGGVKIEAEMKKTAEFNPSEKHLCKFCVDGKISMVFEGSASLILLDSEKLEFKVTFLKLQKKLFDFYWSLDNKEFGIGDCPHRSYRIQVTVVDSSQKPVADAVVNGTKTDSNGSAVLYCKVGEALKIEKSGYQTYNGAVHTSGADEITVTLYKDGEADLSKFTQLVSKTNRILDANEVFKFGLHRYKLFDNVCDTWEEARALCVSLGGHLATISSRLENFALYKYVRETDYLNAYFGYTDRASEGSWKWVTSENISYTNWESGEPNDESGGEDYAMFYWKFTNGRWNDGNFGNGTDADDRSFICEWDSISAYNANKSKIKKLFTADTSLAATGAEYESGEVYREGLVPGTEAMMMIVKGTSDDFTVDSSTILYTAQEEVNEYGEVFFDYCGDFGDKSWVALVFAECAHTDSEWEVTLEPSVIEDGFRVLTCSSCGEILKAETIPKLDFVKDSDEIGILFVNTPDWSNVKVHYWGNKSTQWPGNQMLFSGLYYEGHKVYIAAIPANSDGIVFNGDDEQTEDIVTGIRDGAHWKLGVYESSLWTTIPCSDMRSTNVLGDVDGDGEATVTDATFIQRELTKIPIPFKINKATADTDGDGEVTIIDATFIQSYLVSMPIKYEIGKTISK